MIHYKSPSQIEIMRESALMVSKTLATVAEVIKEGTTTAELNKLAEEFIRDNDAVPGFLGLYGCPSTLLTSVNEAVVHGLPTDKPLVSGDIVSIDCGVLKNKYYGDHAYTFAIGEVAERTKELLEVTKESLYKGIEQCVIGNKVGDIGHAIQSHCEERGFSVVRSLVGHGLGRRLHEDPQVPNFGQPGRGRTLKRGMTLAIEPMINVGTYDVEELSDKWTIVTKDREMSAHFEHNVAITSDGPDILSDFSIIEKVIEKNENLVNI
ncbi:MAG: type I methionyl aminopeptidase [Chlorobiota bacterium]